MSSIPTDDERAARVLDTERRVVREALRARMFGRSVDPVAVGRFVLGRKLGSGATGVVFAAFDPSLGREVAIKFLVRGGRDEAGLFAEARAVARLQHPNLLPAFDVGVHDGVPYIVSELVEGGTLRDAIAAELPPSQRLELLRQIGRGVAEAHRRGIVHRDLKPENVLVGDGRARVTDFGLAATRGESETRSCRIPGTPAYMAPEQLRSERADPLSDQWSFCVLAEELLYGRTPSDGYAGYVAVTPTSVAGNSPFAHLAPVFARGRAADPSARFESMAELLRELDRVDGAFGRRRRLRSFAASGLGALVVVLVGAAGWVRFRGGVGANGDDGIDERVTADVAAGRFDACVARLATTARTEATRRLWVACAERTDDPIAIDRACDAWRGPSTAPDACSPVLREMRRHEREGRPRECAEVGLGATPTPGITVALARCVSAARDVELYRRQCLFLRRQQGSPDPERDCGRPSAPRVRAIGDTSF